MNAQVFFNLLNGNDAKLSEQDHLTLACQKAALFYRQNQRVFIFCDNQQDAHKIDELLWAFDSDSFVPHNLPGEGLHNGSAVEISWQAPTNNRQILINLSSEVPSFASQFSHIIDFVPAEETLKKLARLRYRAYQKLGFNVTTQPNNQAA